VTAREDDDFFTQVSAYLHPPKKRYVLCVLQLKLRFVDDSSYLCVAGSNWTKTLHITADATLGDALTQMAHMKVSVLNGLPLHTILTYVPV